ncbi:erythromycin esterase family protein [Amycolatopsis sp. NPDC051071]|uniref:erythromycin esterase family protein n=1 Tax=Amycolatopsis sp. NPDC051071 TaxID=3154637 RepID=UPI003424B5AC
MSTIRIGRRVLMATAALTAAAALAPIAAHAAPENSRQNTVNALERVSHPLRSTEPGRHNADLRALGEMVADAKIVGLGEATHGSHEFFAMKERVFRYLVEEKGFTGFALEQGWPEGLAINEYLLTGKGDIRALTKTAMANSPWEREEFLHLFEWMRSYNREHPGRPVHFVGDDVGVRLPDGFFAKVTDHVKRKQPQLLAQVNELYTGLRPLDDDAAYLNKPVAERRHLADKAEKALKTLSEVKNMDSLVLQYARSIAQTARYYAVDTTDPAAIPAMQLGRDRAMADNVAWWQRLTGGKVLVSAHNGHVAKVTPSTAMYPKVQGDFLREMYGKHYVSIGMSFNEGSFLSRNNGGPWQKFKVGAPEKNSNEATLDKVRYDDFYFDARTAPASARAWLDGTRPTRSIGVVWPMDPFQVSLGRSYDIVVHLHDVTEAKFLR